MNINRNQKNCRSVRARKHDCSPQIALSEVHGLALETSISWPFRVIDLCIRELDLRILQAVDRLCDTLNIPYSTKHSLRVFARPMKDLPGLIPATGVLRSFIKSQLLRSSETSRDSSTTLRELRKNSIPIWFLRTLCILVTQFFNRLG